MAAVMSTLAMGSTLAMRSTLDEHAVSEEPGRSQDQSIVEKGCKSRVMLDCGKKAANQG
ncbi:MULTISPECIES: hypothetical protein [Paenibacillus]|uniref:hypothetical protein n=1 Tax=Paenibacillus TaxID=44249 RepID=UPI00142D8F0A|nr:hypothetical protein [Paenibacillus rhizosphaerae]